MSKPITDASTGVAEAIANKFIFGDGYTSGIYAVLAYRINYDGAAWQVSTSIGSKQSAGDITAVWDGTDNKLTVSLAGLDNQFTGLPSVVVSATAGATHASNLRFQPQASVTAVDTIVVRFYDPASASAYQTTESTKMAFHMFLLGQIG